ncbi:hypothetical protein SAMN03097699_0369 [Flavobacteriaceae bacterium MAR_2010_188]|nr:hypothetical protein SAMN03097699_0369 [Flavobacteriaceae bacterium MAR_2010_188]
MNIAIVILNYNGIELLKQFLPSVVANSKEASLYIIDNGSTDSSLQYLAENFSNINLINNEKNLGYAGGYNHGLREIKEDLICLLNSDVEVTANWLESIKASFEENPDLGIAQPKILDYKNKNRFEYAGASGGFIDKYGFPFCRGRVFDWVEVDNCQYNDSIEILWASGACFFIRNSLFKDLGGFDASFFAHMEEIDLCWRAFNQNHKCRVVPQSTVYHLGGGTLNYGTPQKTFLNFRNSLFMLVKNLPHHLFRTLVVRMTFDGLAFFKMMLELKPRHAFAIFQAHFYFYFHFPKYLNQRRTMKNTTRYYKTKSIVWSYYVNKIKTSDCL